MEITQTSKQSFLNQKFNQMRNLITGAFILLGVTGRYLALQNQLPTTLILAAVSFFLIVIGTIELTNPQDGNQNE